MSLVCLLSFLWYWRTICKFQVNTNIRIYHDEPTSLSQPHTISFASQQGLKSFLHPLCANGWCGVAPVTKCFGFLIFGVFLQMHLGTPRASANIPSLPQKNKKAKTAKTWHLGNQHVSTPYIIPSNIPWRASIPMCYYFHHRCQIDQAHYNLVPGCIFVMMMMMMIMMRLYRICLLCLFLWTIQDYAYC